ncbi:MAG: dTDP-4-amino-4,6-dideoxyglucose formyltransferase, partial [Actinomycetota bacterium]|nr:dTDP-4-amino-4,6-dideoxyglucose formyltransferase [Actinomycetota bacterium]
SLVFRGPEFRDEGSMQALLELELDYIICVHFPYIVPQDVLEIPRVGVTNLHPALLPYNRGWHTPTWAILDDTPYGATLHFMSAAVDEGDVILQEPLAVSPGDTADDLYRRALRLEEEVFAAAWPLLVSKDPPRRPQDAGVATAHRPADLTDSGIQKIDLSQETTAEDLVRRLRAMTTNNVEEAAYFEVDGKKYRLQLHITEES